MRGWDRGPNSQIFSFSGPRSLGVCRCQRQLASHTGRRAVRETTRKWERQDCAEATDGQLSQETHTRNRLVWEGNGVGEGLHLLSAKISRRAGHFPPPPHTHTQIHTQLNKQTNKEKNKNQIVVHVYNPSTEKAQSGGSLQLLAREPTLFHEP